MRLALLGDVHGCVFHALAAIAGLRKHRGLDIDATIQLGDLGAYAAYDRLPAEDRDFIAESPAQGDIFRLAQLGTSAETVYFLSGNHDDLRWLKTLSSPFGPFRHVPCGTVQILGGARIAYLGRIDEPGSDVDFDAAAYCQLMSLPPRTVDILVTHDGPFGMSSWNGKPQGSRRLLALIERLQPRLHASGHYHHENGPRHYGRTRSYALAQLVPPRPRNAEQWVVPGSVAIYDTTSESFEYIHDEWLMSIRGDGPEVLTNFLGH
ncbi:MAG: metallophosphoesterase [Mycobacterium sp.]|nr:metallophosphoesterase [Mycobacterium sp.]